MYQKKAGAKPDNQKPEHPLNKNQPSPKKPDAWDV